MVSSRIELVDKISQAKSNIASKRTQMSSAKKRAIFRGVRIKDQFREGHSGIKPFRKRRKAQRKSALFDLGIFNNELSGLQNSLMISEQDLADFDLLGGEI